MTAHIFTYGSLMFPEVWQRVVRRAYRSAPGTLSDYARFCVTGQIYPGMIAMPGNSLPGRIYFDVDADDIGLLDAFEGPEYQRVAVMVEFDNARQVSANAYLYQDKAGLSETSWCPEQFQVERFIRAFCTLNAHE